MHEASNRPPITAIPATPWGFFWFATRPRRGLFFMALVIVALAAALSQSSVYIFKLVIDAVEQGNVTQAFWYGLLYPVAILVIQCLYRVSGLFYAYISTSSRKYCYDQLVAYTHGHSKTYFSNRFAGALLSKINNCVNGVDSLLEYTLWTYLDVAITFLVTIVLLAVVSGYAALLFVGLLIVLGIINYALAKRKRVLSKISAEAYSKLQGIAVDTFTNIDAVRQFTRRSFELGHVGAATTVDSQTSLTSKLYSEMIFVVNGILLFIVFSAVTYLVLLRWQAGLITAGDVVFVLALFGQITGTLIFVGQSFQNAAAAIGEMQEGLTELIVPHDIIDHPGATALTVTDGKIDWQNVTFEYDHVPVFTDFTLTIPSGQRLGLVGASGAGKSTFVSLLLRQHELTGGSILIDGQPIHLVTQDSLRTHIAVVPQEPALFHRTIKENIAYGKPGATDEGIIAVAKKAQAHDFISALPQGYDTLVGERGVKLSGGQKQRVAIARAMLKDAPILILDEATSALDSESEAAIQKALHFLMAGKTVIAIAHRLSTLREMDRIIVLERGRIIEDGTHETLKHSGGTYARLWEHQAGGFVGE